MVIILFYTVSVSYMSVVFTSWYLNAHRPSDEVAALMAGRPAVVAGCSGVQRGERGREGGRDEALLKGSRLRFEWELCVYVRLRGEAGGLH